MNAEELVKISDGLGWIVERITSMPDKTEDAAIAAMACAQAQLIVTELAVHLSRGVDPYETLKLASVGVLPASPEKVTMLKIFSSRPKE